jgi:selenocysteine-specific elongation factor
VLGRIILLDEQDLGKDSGTRTGLAQLHLEEELVAAREDRLVLRFYSPVTSIAGGVVLDPSPRNHKRFEAQALEALHIMEDGDTADLFRQNLSTAGLAGLGLEESLGHHEDPACLQAGKRLYDRGLLENLGTEIKAILDQYAQRFPLRVGIPKEETRRKCKFPGSSAEWNAVLQALAVEQPWVVVGDRIALTLEGPALGEDLSRAIAEALAEWEAFGLNWPGTDEWAESSAVFRRAVSTPALKALVPAEVVKHCVDHGYAVAINSEYHVSRSARDGLVDKLRQHFQDQEDLPFALFRELSGLTRKLGIPMLEHLDQSGVTVRAGDVRKAGPTLLNHSEEDDG